jgi:plasmid stabilization system protein ParE
MAFDVYVSERALRDLDVLAFHIKANSSPETAQAWFDGIVEAIQTLKDMPERYPVNVECRALEQEVRVLMYGKRNRRYKVYYSVQRRTAKAGAVQVLHVRHYSRRGPTQEELRVEI